MALSSNKQATGKDIHELFLEVFMLQAELSAVMDRFHEQAGMSTPQHRIVRQLIAHGDATVPDLAFGLGVSRQFVLKTCNAMKARGYIEFAPNPRHKRSNLVTLTAAGKR